MLGCSVGVLLRRAGVGGANADAAAAKAVSRIMRLIMLGLLWFQDKKLHPCFRLYVRSQAQLGKPRFLGFEDVIPDVRCSYLVHNNFITTATGC